MLGGRTGGEGLAVWVKSEYAGVVAWVRIGVGMRGSLGGLGLGLVGLDWVRRLSGGRG